MRKSRSHFMRAKIAINRCAWFTETLRRSDNAAIKPEPTKPMCCCLTGAGVSLKRQLNREIDERLFVCMLCAMLAMLTMLMIGSKTTHAKKKKREKRLQQQYKYTVIAEVVINLCLYWASSEANAHCKLAACDLL